MSKYHLSSTSYRHRTFSSSHLLLFSLSFLFLFFFPIDTISRVLHLLPLIYWFPFLLKAIFLSLLNIHSFEMWGGNLLFLLYSSHFHFPWTWTRGERMRMKEIRLIKALHLLFLFLHYTHFLSSHCSSAISSLTFSFIRVSLFSLLQPFLSRWLTKKRRTRYIEPAAVQVSLEAITRVM